MTSAPPRLKRRREFVRAASQGRKVAAPGLVLQAVPREDAAPEARCGFTVSKRVGNAVVRNRARRRLRAVAAEIMPGHALGGFDYVLIGRAATGKRNYDALRRDLMSALKRLRLFHDTDQPDSQPLREQS